MSALRDFLIHFIAFLRLFVFPKNTLSRQPEAYITFSPLR